MSFEALLQDGNGQWFQLGKKISIENWTLIVFIDIKSSSHNKFSKMPNTLHLTIYYWLVTNRKIDQ